MPKLAKSMGGGGGGQNDLPPSRANLLQLGHWGVKKWERITV